MNQAVPPLSGPLHMDTIALAGGGVVGMTHCPGRCTVDGRGRQWARDLAQDVEALRLAGMGTVVTLLATEELAALGVRDLGAQVQQAGLAWLQIPVPDFGVPDRQAQALWRGALTSLTGRLQDDGRVLVHCAAGLGRTGTMVATLLKVLGDDSETAIARVRAARPGTIETAAQRAFVVEFNPQGR